MRFHNKAQVMITMPVLCLYYASTMPVLCLLCLCYAYYQVCLYYACTMPTMPVLYLLCLYYAYYACTMPTMPIYTYQISSSWLLVTRLAVQLQPDYMFIRQNKSYPLMQSTSDIRDSNKRNFCIRDGVKWFWWFSTSIVLKYSLIRDTNIRDFCL